MYNERPFISFSEFSARQGGRSTLYDVDDRFMDFDERMDYHAETYSDITDFQDEEFMSHLTSIFNFGLTIEEKEFVKKRNLVDSLDGITVVSTKEGKVDTMDLDSFGDDCGLSEYSSNDALKCFDDDVDFLDTIPELTRYRGSPMNETMLLDINHEYECDEGDDFICEDDPIRVFFNKDTLIKAAPLLSDLRESGVQHIVNRHCTIDLPSDSVQRFERWITFKQFLDDTSHPEIERGKVLFHQYYNDCVKPYLKLDSDQSIAMMLHCTNLVAYLLRVGFSLELGDSMWRIQVRKLFFYFLGLLEQSVNGICNVRHFLSVTGFGVVEGFSKYLNEKFYHSLFTEVCNLVSESNCGMQWRGNKLFVYNEHGDIAFGMWYVFSSQFYPGLEEGKDKDPPRIGVPLLKAMKTFIEASKVESLNVLVNPWAESYSYHGPFSSYAEPFLVMGDDRVYDFVSELTDNPSSMVLTVLNQSARMVSVFRKVGRLPLVLKWRSDVEQECEHHIITITDVGVDFTLYMIKSKDVDHLIVIRWKEFPGDVPIIKALLRDKTIAVYSSGRLVAGPEEGNGPLMIRVPISLLHDISGSEEEREPGGVS